MRLGFSPAALAVVVSLLIGLVSAQQYVGDVIPNSLPGVPGSEITYFRINDPSGRNNNLTLINYYSHQNNGQRIVESQIMRAVVIIHGLNRDPGTYESNMLSALAQVTSDPNVNTSSIAIMAPYFPNGDDKGSGYPWTSGLLPGKGSTSNCLVWPGSQWSAGGNNQYPYTSTNTSTYTVLDQIIRYFDNAGLFPKMNQIIIAGHSLGGQTVQRYTAIGQPGDVRTPVSYWIANPNSYAWLSTDRPLSTASCSIYDVYREGYTNFTLYPMTYGVSLVKSGRANILTNYQSKQIAYGRGTQDLGDDSSTCAPFTTGANRNERFFNFIEAFPPSCPDPTGTNCDTVDFVNAGHDAGAMMASAAGQARLFLDNFYGNGNRSYDFGYPRQQAGDDPYPNPALNGTLASVNNNTYAGNMTYWGCWSDHTPPSLTNLATTTDAMTIETCTSICAQGNNTIAGIEYGTQCFCGNALTCEATEVTDSSCASPCSGNSSEICGGANRLSLFSNGRPNVQSAPEIPEVVDGSYYIACYTEATSGRALNAKSTSGSFMTLEYCANFCSGYQYFGTEYGDECYCGNSFATGANTTSDNDCNMLCAADSTEFCGSDNRLTVYQNVSWTPSSTTTAATSPTTITTSPNSASTSVSCPSCNNTIITSNGMNFTVECGIDHQGGDVTSLSVANFQACIDACAQNSQCVDVSLSGSACYLKSTLGAAVQNAGIAGARLVSGGSSSSATSATTATTAGQVATSVASTATSLNSGSTFSSVSCPGSNSTIYTASNGVTFLIECGIDHASGDMSSTRVNTFADCINACATTSGCVDVSLSGSACYLKSTLGAALQNGGVWGAKAVSSTSTLILSSAPLSTPTQVASSPTSTGTSLTSTPTTLSTNKLSSPSSTTITSTSSSSISTSTATSASAVLPSDFASLGCYVDNNPSRALPNSNGTSPKQTPQQCALKCRANGYKYSGTEYASECWCGNPSPSTSAPASDCNMKCSGDSTQVCGAGNRLSVVVDNTWKRTFFAAPSYNTWNLIACYVDSVNGRILPNAISLAASGGSSNATIGNCVDACADKGYAYCGEEYYSECYGSNTAPASASIAPGADPLTAGCNYPCNGNNSEACGGSNRILVYFNNGTSA